MLLSDSLRFLTLPSSSDLSLTTYPLSTRRFTVDVTVAFVTPRRSAIWEDVIPGL